MVVGAVALAFACTGRAERAQDSPEPPSAPSAVDSPSKGEQGLEAAAKKIIAAYLRAEARGNYAAMTPLFTHDARLKYTYVWGHGYEDTVYEIDFSKARDSGDETYLDDLDGYEIIERKSRVQRLNAKADGQVEALVIVTEKYRYRGYSGTAKTRLDLSLRQTNGDLRIASLTSVAKY